MKVRHFLITFVMGLGHAQSIIPLVLDDLDLDMRARPYVEVQYFDNPNQMDPIYVESAEQVWSKQPCIRDGILDLWREFKFYRKCKFLRERRIQQYCRS